jgi:tetratricopeptide (TPR) repeat protein
VSDIQVRDYLSQAEVLLNSSRFVEADMLLLKARSMAPELNSLKVAQVRAFIGMGRYDEAGDLLDKLPDERGTKLLRARLFRSKGDLKRAIELYKEIGELRNASDLHFILGEEYEAFCLSEESLRLSNYDDLEAFRHTRLGFAVGVNVVYDRRGASDAKFHYIRGIALLESARIEDSLQSFRAAKLIGGGSSEMYSDIDIMEAFIRYQLFPNDGSEALAELIHKRRGTLNFIPGAILVDIIGAVSK